MYSLQTHLFTLLTVCKLKRS